MLGISKKKNLDGYFSEKIDIRHVFHTFRRVSPLSAFLKSGAFSQQKTKLTPRGRLLAALAECDIFPEHQLLEVGDLQRDIVGMLKT